MRTLRALRVSARGLFAHRMRATLAVASVAAGVVAVIVTGAIGEGTKEEVLRQTENMGTNLLVVKPADVRFSPARRELKGEMTSLKLDDYQAILRLPRVSDAAPGIQNPAATVKANNRAMGALILGTTSSYVDVCRFHLHEGRFLSPEDNLNASRVVVLEARVTETLFGEENPIGQEVRIRGIPFEVIGVLEAKGVLADGSDVDGGVIIPIHTALRRMYNFTFLNQVFITVRNISEMDTARQDVAQLLRDRHRLNRGGKPDDFVIQDKTQVLAVRRRLAESLTLLATGLAAASLAVGGAGILALMLMSVKERTSEIGLRMAIGAKPRDILVQFLLESTSIAAGGWILGMALGTIATFTVAKATTWATSSSPELVLSTLAVVAITGLGFGAYPARKASLMPPIQALRME
jgi:putative ABC transport system permease protein